MVLSLHLHDRYYYYTHAQGIFTIIWLYKYYIEIRAREFAFTLNRLGTDEWWNGNPLIKRFCRCFSPFLFNCLISQCRVFGTDVKHRLNYCLNLAIRCFGRPVLRCTDTHRTQYIHMQFGHATTALRTIANRRRALRTNDQFLVCRQNFSVALDGFCEEEKKNVACIKWPKIGRHSTWDGVYLYMCAKAFWFCCTIIYNTCLSLPYIYGVECFMYGRFWILNIGNDDAKLIIKRVRFLINAFVHI